MYDKTFSKGSGERRGGNSAGCESQEDCGFCQRPKCVVQCDACKKKMVFMRVRKTCKKHPKNSFMMDLTKCPHCKSEEIREIRKLGWYDQSYTSDDECTNQDDAANNASLQGRRSENGNREGRSVVEPEVSVVGEKNDDDQDTDKLIEGTPKDEIMKEIEDLMLDAKITVAPSTPIPQEEVDHSAKLSARKKCDCIQIAAWTVCNECSDYRTKVTVSVKCKVHSGCFTTGLSECPKCHTDASNLARFDVN